MLLLKRKIKRTWNRFIYNLGLDYIGKRKWGFFVIRNFIWNANVFGYRTRKTGKKNDNDMGRV